MYPITPLFSLQEDGTCLKLNQELSLHFVCHAGKLQRKMWLKGTVPRYLCLHSFFKNPFTHTGVNDTCDNSSPVSLIQLFYSGDIPKSAYSASTQAAVPSFPVASVHATPQLSPLTV